MVILPNAVLKIIYHIYTENKRLFVDWAVFQNYSGATLVPGLWCFNPENT